jgi:UDP-glucose 4-epimerase
MRAMVTGGAGFIGSTLVDRLLAEGHDVEVVDDLSTGSLSNLESAQTAGSKFVFHHLDIRLPDMTELVMERRPQVIFHLAAQMDVRVSVERPVFDADINVIGTLRILEGARAAGCQRIVFAASGGTLYGEVDSADLPVVETHAHRPLSPYGVSKKAGIDYLVAFRELYGLSFYALALANVFGPRQDPHGEAGVVAIFAQRLVAGEPVTIYGDGEQTRDYVYVNDVVDAFVRAADRGDGGVRNIGTGHRTSVNELYRTMAQAAGSGAAPEYAPARRGDLKDNALSADLAREELGWEPVTGLAEGTGAVIEFVRAQAT